MARVGRFSFLSSVVALLFIVLIQLSGSVVPASADVAKAAPAKEPDFMKPGADGAKKGDGQGKGKGKGKGKGDGKGKGKGKGKGAPKGGPAKGGKGAAKGGPKGGKGGPKGGPKGGKPAGKGAKGGPAKGGRGSAKGAKGGKPAGKGAKGGKGEKKPSQAEKSRAALEKELPADRDCKGDETCLSLLEELKLMDEVDAMQANIQKTRTAIKDLRVARKNKDEL